MSARQKALGSEVSTYRHVLLFSYDGYELFGFNIPTVPGYRSCLRTLLIAIHYFSKFVRMGYGLCGSGLRSGSVSLKCGSSPCLRVSWLVG